MSDARDELRGALFKNDKGDNPKRPDYRGTCQVAGVAYGISAWLKTARNGKTYMQLRLEKKPPAPLTRPVRDEVAFDDDIPF